MRTMMRWTTALMSVLVLVSAGCGTAVPASPLWPPIEPYETGYLRVSEIHEIYYELSGNPEGIPVFVLHGGPGGSTAPVYRRYCDPGKYLIVLHDQRGAGKSRPEGELRENDTWALVEDIERLRKHLGLEKVVLFGGSWGSTLALAHAEKHPDTVAGLVLRGVFLGSRAEVDHFYHGGAARMFPEAYERLLSELPDPDRRPLPAYLYELISTAHREDRHEYCRAWARYEVSMAALEVPDAWVDDIDATFGGKPPCVFSLFENYYMSHGCFLKEGQLLRDAHRLKGIPTYIVNGRYDVVCPPATAYELHRRIEGSELIIAERSGHWMGEPNIETALLDIFRRGF